MSLTSRIWSWIKRASPTGRVSLDDPTASGFFGGGMTKAGKSVNHNVALHYGPYFAGVRVLTFAMLQLPIHVTKRDEMGNELKDPTHPLNRVLRIRPNPKMSPKLLFQTMFGHYHTRGNAYAAIAIDERGRRALFPLHPDLVQIMRTGTSVNGLEEFFYIYHSPNTGRQITLDSSQVIHVRYYTDDGVEGKSILQLMRETVGRGLASEQHGSQLYKQGAIPTGVVSAPNKMTPDTRKNLRQAVIRAVSGQEAYGILILDHGMKFDQMSVSHADAQHLESRMFETEEIARWLGVPPYLIGDFRNSQPSDEADRSFVKWCLVPHLVKFEDEFAAKLFTEEERERHGVMYDADRLLRGSMLERMQAARIRRQWGLASINDIRREEGQEPVEGGDEYLEPMNMVQVGDGGRDDLLGDDDTQDNVSGQGTEGDDGEGDGDSDSGDGGSGGDDGGKGEDDETQRALDQAVVIAVREPVARMSNWERGAVKRNAKPGTWDKWREGDFYDGFRSKLVTALQASLDALDFVTGDDASAAVAQAIADQWVAHSKLFTIDNEYHAGLNEMFAAHARNFLNDVGDRVAGLRRQIAEGNSHATT